jgi:hypothetical protein
MVWKYERGLLARIRLLCTTTATQLLIIGGLVLALLTLAACQQDSPTLASQGSTPTPTRKSAQISQSITPPPTRKPTLARSSTQRDHVPPGTSPLFARITFTTSITYDQAVAILTAAGDSPYPWTCDNPRTPTPPPLAQLRAAFASSHQLLVSYPSDSLLNQLASSSQVVSVDAVPLFMCP